jgi:response regulator RpfG family c-di-GMP phosphodiesterase
MNTSINYPLLRSNKDQLFNQLKVLLVDDQKDQLELAKINLKKIDPNLLIITADTPAEAQSLYQNSKPDCIVSDYQMPEMNGIQLYSSLKTSEVPFILYTVHDGEEIKQKVLSTEIDDCVKKEQTLSHYNVLALKIRRAVDRRRSASWVRAYSEIIKN